MAVAFAVWEAAGLLLVTVAGALLLNETLSPLRLLALLGLAQGAWLLHDGTMPVQAVQKVVLKKPASARQTTPRASPTVRVPQVQP